MSQELSESSFTLLVENGFPLSANVKLQLLDENMLLLDSLNNNTIIEAAPIGEKWARKILLKVKLSFLSIILMVFLTIQKTYVSK